MTRVRHAREAAGNRWPPALDVFGSSGPPSTIAGSGSATPSASQTTRPYACDASYRLSVVVAARNEQRNIAELLGDLKSQSLATTDYEVIIVDGASTDATLQIAYAHASHMPNVKVAENPRRWASSSRNMGAAHARSPYLLFVDAHCRIPSNTMLADVLAAFDAGAQCVSRPQPLTPGTNRLVARSIAFTRSTPLAHMPRSMIYRDEPCWADPASAGCGYTRALFEALGGFDERFDACEDVEFNLRVRDIGIRAHHSPKFAVCYLSRETWPELAIQMFRYGLGRGRLACKRRARVPLAAYLPGATLVLLLLTCVAAMLHPVAFFVAVGIAAALAGGAVSCAISVTCRAGTPTGVLSAVTFLVILVSAGLGSLAGLCSMPRGLARRAS